MQKLNVDDMLKAIKERNFALQRAKFWELVNVEGKNEERFYKVCFHGDSKNFGTIIKGDVQPLIVEQNLYLCTDDWNSGHNRRVQVSKGSRIFSLKSHQIYEDFGVGGTECDKMKGIWATNYKYGYGTGENFRPE